MRPWVLLLLLSCPLPLWPPPAAHWGCAGAEVEVPPVFRALRKLWDRALRVPLHDDAQVLKATRQVRIYCYPPLPDLPHPLVVTNRSTWDEEFKKLDLQAVWKAETEVLEGLDRLGMLTTDPKEASFFWVPHMLISYWAGGPDLMPYWSETLKPFLKHIVHDLPYFNNSGGTDHLFLYLFDQGPVCESMAVTYFSWFQNDPFYKDVVHPMIVLSYYGTKDMPILYTPRLSEFRPHCHKTGHDVVLPPFNKFPLPDPSVLVDLEWCVEQQQPASDACQRLGMYLAALANGREAPLAYKGTFREGLAISPKVRPWIQTYCPSPNCVVGPVTEGVYSFCPAGWGPWSLRMQHAMSVLSIPVIMADRVVEPFERFFNYRAFTTKVMTGGLDHISITVIHPTKSGEEPFAATQSADVPIINHRLKWRMNRVAGWARQFKSACRGLVGFGRTQDQWAECVTHPVALKILTLALVRPWFSYDTARPQNVYKLLALELFCRMRRRDSPEHPVFCGHNSSHIALETYIR